MSRSRDSSRGGIGLGEPYDALTDGSGHTPRIYLLCHLCSSCCEIDSTNLYYLVQMDSVQLFILFKHQTAREPEKIVHPKGPQHMTKSWVSCSQLPAQGTPPKPVCPQPESRFDIEIARLSQRGPTVLKSLDATQTGSPTPESTKISWHTFSRCL